jgi:hypothetical protein
VNMDDATDSQTWDLVARECLLAASRRLVEAQEWLGRAEEAVARKALPILEDRG